MRSCRSRHQDRSKPNLMSATAKGRHIAIALETEI
jgi:hypothetical protein